MEAQDRGLAFVGEGRCPLPGSQSTTEFTKLLVETVFALRLSVERANGSQSAPPLSFFKYHTNDGRSVPCITGLKNSFSLNGRLPGAQSREGFSLEATIWSGGPPSLDRFAFDKPRPQTSRAFHLGYSIANGYAWMGADSASTFSPRELGEELIAWYLDNGR
jgi:hypothetical protein